MVVLVALVLLVSLGQNAIETFPHVVTEVFREETRLRCLLSVLQGAGALFYK